MLHIVGMSFSDKVRFVGNNNLNVDEFFVKELAATVEALKNMRPQERQAQLNAILKEIHI